MHTWDRISNALGEPVVSVEIGGVPLRAERYIFQLGGCQVPPLDSLVLACHLGGARATAGRNPGRSFDFLAGASTVFQPGFASRWTFCGAIDMAMFHFLDPDHEMVRHLQRLLAARAKAPMFSDPLVHAAAQQLLAEVGRRLKENVYTVRTWNARKHVPEGIQEKLDALIAEHLAEIQAEQKPAKRRAK